MWSIRRTNIYLEEEQMASLDRLAEQEVAVLMFVEPQYSVVPVVAAAELAIWPFCPRDLDGESDGNFEGG